MLFANDTDFVNDMRTGVNAKLELWSQTLEFQSFRLSPKKSIWSANLFNEGSKTIVL